MFEGVEKDFVQLKKSFISNFFFWCSIQVLFVEKIESVFS